jgi:hypothetical protein
MFYFEGGEAINGNGAASDQKISKFCASYMEEFVVGNVGVNAVYYF